jgi:hypothetical protein
MCVLRHRWKITLRSHLVDLSGSLDWIDWFGLFDSHILLIRYMWYDTCDTIRCDTIHLEVNKQKTPLVGCAQACGWTQRGGCFHKLAGVRLQSTVRFALERTQLFLLAALLLQGDDFLKTLPLESRISIYIVESAWEDPPQGLDLISRWPLTHSQAEKATQLGAPSVVWCESSLPEFRRLNSADKLQICSHHLRVGLQHQENPQAWRD